MTNQDIDRIRKESLEMVDNKEISPEHFVVLGKLLDSYEYKLEMLQKTFDDDLATIGFEDTMSVFYLDEQSPLVFTRGKLCPHCGSEILAEDLVSARAEMADWERDSFRQIILNCYTCRKTNRFLNTPSIDKALETEEEVE